MFSQTCILIAEGGCTLGQGTATTPKGDDTNSAEDNTTLTPPAADTTVPPTVGPVNTPEPTNGPDSGEVSEATVKPTTPSPDVTTTIGDSEAVTTTSPQETTKADVTNDFEQTTESSVATTTTGNVEVTTPAPICPPGVIGNLPHPDKCEGFYMCTSGIAIELLCSAGFEFDPETKVS